MAETPPITADEPDPNIAWTSQKGSGDPYPYSTDVGNPVDEELLPSAQELAKIGIDISTAEKKAQYFRFVKVIPTPPPPEPEP